MRKILGAINFVVLQWLGLRLAEVVDVETGRHRSWIILVGVVPMTGWNAPFRKFFR